MTAFGVANTKSMAACYSSTSILGCFSVIYCTCKGYIVITAPGCVGSTCELIVPCFDKMLDNDNNIETIAAISISAIHTVPMSHKRRVLLSIRGGKF